MKSVHSEQQKHAGWSNLDVNKSGEKFVPFRAGSARRTALKTKFCLCMNLPYGAFYEVNCEVQIRSRKMYRH